ncbi:hypothetical protein G7061_04125 [Erysipelothrix sp. HDW6B]|uniref:hypothetical protein n=1 Tax=Erysipelothrix sp. HDW6B TaxID=2714929 RepID=UPI00140B41DC|nr:hypothetical protein [Erysipelothrix sp. HDW6B]QIK85842.1 hypothetical protein G7061_04125 [Erysipelothrix sp. HDW6B]
MNNEILNAILQEEIENFENHEAVMIVDTEDVQVMDWKSPGSSHYAIRFVLNRNHMYLSGDLGSAVFDLTWFPRFTDNWTESYQYLKEKIVSWSEQYSTWNVNVLEKDIEEWIEEQKSEDFDRDELEKIEEILRECLGEVEYSGTGGEWSFWIALNGSRISDYDVDYHETFNHFGKTTPLRFYLWVEALRMASIQLNAND